MGCLHAIYLQLATTTMTVFFERGLDVQLENNTQYMTQFI
jgi:hypothetical protein